MLGKSTLQSAFAHWKGITRASKEGLEVWAPVSESHYLVSTFGNVKNGKTGRLMKGCHNGLGYLNLSLCFVPGKKTMCLVHRLVAIAFIPNPCGKLDVDHVDNCRSNNIVSNLRFATRRENGRNKSVYKRSKTGVAGVRFYQPNQTWLASIVLDSKKRHLGTFTTKEEATAARVKAANELFGEFTHSSQKVA